ncbi:MAG: hypothetical protein ABR555_14175 [Pyrinomonadaceae bacterium]
MNDGFTTRLRSDPLVAAAIFCLTLAIFLSSHVHQVSDSNYSMLLSESLLRYRTFTLDHFALPRHEPRWTDYYFANGPIYQIQVVNGHLYYYLPPGSSILSLPFVAAMNAIGISASNPDGTYNPKGEISIEASLAALLMSSLVVIFFYSARLTLPLSWSIAVAVIASLGTQIFSTASRALWSETWGVLLLGIAIYLILATELKQHAMRPTILATLLAWSYFARPTFAIAVVGITFYVLMFQKKSFFRYAATGFVWFVLFVAYSWYHFHDLLPTYYRASRLDFSSFWTALAGNLMSPGRGLLVFVPGCLVVVYLLVKHRRSIRLLRLVAISAAVIGAHMIVISAFPHWWGGHSFGPRFSTGLVPWFVLLAILAVDGKLRAPRVTQWLRFLECAVATCLLAASLLINTAGATERATWNWNLRPASIDEHPERLWDWRQPQFMAKFLPFPAPHEFPDLPKVRVDFSHGDGQNYLWYGWSRDDANDIWADNDAAFIFSADETEDISLQLSISAFVVPGRLTTQPLAISFNDQPLTHVELDTSLPREIVLRLPATRVKGKNVLHFLMPSAQSSQMLGIGEDPRLRSFKLLWVQLVNSTR